MKKVDRKYGIALALLVFCALLKVTLVPNLQHTALYQHLLDIEYTVQSTITHSLFSFSARCNTTQLSLQFFV